MTNLRWALVVLVITSVIEFASPSNIVFLSFLGLGPLLAALDGPPRNTALIGGAAVACSVASAAIHYQDLSTWFLIGSLVTALVSLAAWRLAVHRSEREERLQAARPHVERSLRLLRAMNAGGMGEWWVDRSTGKAHWDDGVAQLFDLEGEELEGDLSTLIASIDPDDREMLDALVERTVADVVGFRRDHRVRHQDGTVHWVEVIVDPVVESGRVTGLVGLVQSTDERHAALEERDRLLSIEAAARQRVEFLDRLHEVVDNALDIEGILERLAAIAVPELADWVVASLTIDTSLDRPARAMAFRNDEEGRRLRERVAIDECELDRRIDAAVTDWRSVSLSRRSIVWTRGSDAAVMDSFVQWAKGIGATSVVSLPLMSPLGMLGVLQLVRGQGSRAPSVNDVELAEELASRASSVLHGAVLRARLELSRANLVAIQSVTGELAAAATLSDVASAVLEEGRRAMRAEGAALFVAEGSGGLRLERAEGAVPPIEFLRPVAERVVAERWLAQSPVEEHDVTIAAFPLEGGSGVIGVVEFILPDGRALTESELGLLDVVASRTAAAIDRASTYQREHDVAFGLQRRLLPDSLTSPPWLRVAVRYEPATGGSIGGDWYQMVDLGDRRTAVAVGDAVGHGVVSAAAMGQLRASVATALSATRDPAIALTIVDRFASLSPDTTGASLGLALIDAAGSVQYSSAGHPPVVLARASGQISALAGGRRPLLGLGGDSPPAVGTVAFATGDSLVLYSDGLIETRHRPFDVGLAELQSVLGDVVHLDVDVIASELVDRMTRGVETEDDVAVMVVRRAVGE